MDSAASGGGLFGLLLKLDIKLRPILLKGVCRVTMWSDMFESFR